MRKLMLFICSICICILSSFSFAYALDDEIYYGKFFGDEYMIMPLNPEIDYLYNLDGYQITTSYWGPNSNWVDFQQVQYIERNGNMAFRIIVDLPSSIPSNTPFDVKLRVVHNGVFIQANNFRAYDGTNVVVDDDIIYQNLTSVSEMFYSYGVESASPINRLIFYFNMNYADGDTASVVVTELDISAFNNTGLIRDILGALSDIGNYIMALPSNIANSFNHFFHSDDPIIGENDDLNDDLSDSVDQYDDIESGLVDDFNSNISNLNTDVDLFNMTDFISTSNFLSTQLTNIFSINQNIQNMIMYSLIMGFAFVLIGIGVKR